MTDPMTMKTTPALPAMTIKYEWSNVSFYVSPSLIGTQFKADLSYTKDACTATKPSNGVASNKSYGTELIEMDGGKSTGDDCEAYAYHGYNGIERETVEKMKAWIMAGG